MELKESVYSELLKQSKYSSIIHINYLHKYHVDIDLICNNLGISIEDYIKSFTELMNEGFICIFDYYYRFPKTYKANKEVS